MENDRKNGDLQSLGSLFAGRKKEDKKPPAHPWQDLALRAVKELNAPSFKRSSIFQVCRDYPRSFIEICLNDTKELCLSGEKWKYFLKIISNRRREKEEEK